MGFDDKISTLDSKFSKPVRLSLKPLATPVCRAIIAALEEREYNYVALANRLGIGSSARDLEIERYDEAISQLLKSPLISQTAGRSGRQYKLTEFGRDLYNALLKL